MKQEEEAWNRHLGVERVNGLETDGQPTDRRPGPPGCSDQVLQVRPINMAVCFLFSSDAQLEVQSGRIKSNQG